MSADNWTVCPECKALAEIEYAKLQKEAKTSYGKVSEVEYQAIISRSKKPLVDDETLRENYSIDVGKDGMFNVSYSGYCTNCDFVFKYKYNEYVLRSKY